MAVLARFAKPGIEDFNQRSKVNFAEDALAEMVSAWLIGLVEAWLAVNKA